MLWCGCLGGLGVRQSVRVGEGIPTLRDPSACLAIDSVALGTEGALGCAIRDCYAELRPLLEPHTNRLSNPSAGRLAGASTDATGNAPDAI